MIKIFPSHMQEGSASWKMREEIEDILLDYHKNCTIPDMATYHYALDVLKCFNRYINGEYGKVEEN